jgi:hypothetical protein
VISEAVADPKNCIAELVEKEKDQSRVVEEIYLSTLGRLPTEAEQKNIVAGAASEKRLEDAQDLAWALLNSPAFLFNR